MLQHLRQLKKGEPINCPIYDYTVHNRSRNFQVIYPTNVIIVEGILIFENKELCKEMDIKIFVDTDADIRIIRRIQRDVIDACAFIRVCDFTVYEYGKANARGICRAE